ncbi:MAG: 6-bladed beta-propeller [Chitinophagaceae bacterium]
MYRLLCFILLGLYSCDNKETKSNHVLDKNMVYIDINDNSLPISQVIDSFWYIILESNDSITTPLSNIDKLLIVDNYIYILDVKYASVKVFDINGKYEHDIGALGVSKGLYTKISDIAYNKSHNTIFILCNLPKKRLLEYTINGRFIREIFLKNGATAIALKSPNLFYYFLNNGGEGRYKDYNVLVTDSDNNVKDVFFNIPWNIDARIGFTGGLYTCGDSLYYNPPLSNVYYSLLDNGTRKSAYLISFGGDNLPSEFKSTNDMIQQIPKHSYLGKSLVMTSKFIGFNYIEKGGGRMQAYYNIKSKHIAKTDSSHNSMYSLFMGEIFQTNDTLITCCTVSMLKKWLMKNKNSIKGNMTELYKDIINKNDHDNPILIFYKLKYF